MLLVNIDRESNQEMFSELFGKMEEKSNLNLLFIYGFGEFATGDFIKETIDLLREEKGILEEDKREILPIVIYGKHPKVLYMDGHDHICPAFSTCYDHYKSLHRESKHLYLRIAEQFDFKSGVPLTAPSGALYGYIRLPQDDDVLQSPSVYIHYNFFASRRSLNPLWDKAFQYLVGMSLHTLVDGYRKPTFRETNSELNISSNVDTLMSKMLEHINIDIEKSQRDADCHKELLIQSLRQLDEARSRLATYAEITSVEKQMQIINERDDVEWATVDEKSLHIMTKHIYIKEDSHTRDKFDPPYDIGRILMTVHLKNGTVYFDNVTRKVHGLLTSKANHPHDASSSGGKICLGEVESFVPTLIHQMELAALAELLFNFARSVNTSDSAGKTIERWPKAR